MNSYIYFSGFQKLVISQLTDIKTVQNDILKKLEALTSSRTNEREKESVIKATPISDLETFSAFDNSIDDDKFEQLVSN